MQLCCYNFHPISQGVKPIQPGTIYNFILLRQFDYHKLISASSAVTSSNLFSKLLLPFKPAHPITTQYCHTLIGHYNKLSKDHRMLIRAFNDERLDCQRKYAQDQYEFPNDILFIYYFQLLYLTFVVCMLPHTFLALLLKSREGVVRGKSYYDYDTYYQYYWIRMYSHYQYKIDN